ncbi:uncharacterized protein LOC118751578 [Rhagoletis pomonella]|uniref:uncharacterized protein LOC118751578 n=1 Tax=Rhagoletis pomonella TaxID=28610 RepID=UPI0017864781|nr:uncharacterized protein LOC118751578 [Rhagoletis pomonella]
MEVQDKCVICQISMKRKTIVRILPCKHLLHALCSKEIVESGSCPICRQVITETEAVQRKKYKAYTSQDRSRIVEAANRNEDWVGLAGSLGVNYKTAYTWVTSGRDNSLQRGGRKAKYLTDGELDSVIKWVEEDCTVTLKKLKTKVRNAFQKDVSTSTMGNHLQGRLYTIKSIHHQPATINSAVNKAKRAEYVTTLNSYIQAGKQVIYIDETNFNLFCRRKRGRARSGCRAVQILPAARGPNIHLIGAIATCVVAMERRRGSFKASDACQWIHTVIQKWVDLGNNLGDLVVVCDNAPCHSHLESAINNFNATDKATLLRLGPYSPMLTPIENIWSM